MESWEAIAIFQALRLGQFWHACNMPLTAHRHVNGKPLKIGINWRKFVPFHPLDLQKTVKKEADLKPHRFRHWLTPKPDPAFNAKCADICEVYQAAAGADDSHRTVSINEMTGIQALERAAPGLPMKPGKVERCEFEYRR